LVGKIRRGLPPFTERNELSWDWSVFAALSPDSVDISPISASNTKFNFNAHRLSNAHVIQGDLLEAISHKFDFIFFNAPFYRERPGDWLERAVTDDNYDSLKRFIADVKRCLAVDGRVMLGFSKTGEVLLDAELRRAEDRRD
jgi:methylase of polypeptide subunit release factors